jgi:hypothetical protein
MVRAWDPETSPAKVAEAIVGEVFTETDDGPMQLYVEHDTLGRGLVFVNIVQTFVEGGGNDGAAIFPVPLKAGTAIGLAAMLVTAAGKAVADKDVE